MGNSYVPIQQPEPIQTISFNRLSPNTAQIICNGFSTIIANISETIGKTVTRSDQRICIKNRKELLKYIFPLSSLRNINNVPWTGTNVQNAIDYIMANVFGGDGDAVGKFNQVITFVAPASVPHGHAPFALTGVSDSGLPLSYASSDNTKFTIAGNILTPVAAGTANITASQAGDANYNPAIDVVVPYTLT